jgi:hypothetical protein
LTGKRAKATHKDQTTASPEFAKNLQQPDVAGVQEDEELNDDAQGDVVVHDGIDSSKMINEEVEDLILQELGHLLVDNPDTTSDNDDLHIVGKNLEKYTGHDFSPHGYRFMAMDRVGCNLSYIVLAQVAMIHTNVIFSLQ